MKQYPERDALIFEMYKDGKTLREIGKFIGLSQERIRQIKDYAIRELRKQGIAFDKDADHPDVHYRRPCSDNPIRTFDDYDKEP